MDDVIGTSYIYVSHYIIDHMPHINTNLIRPHIIANLIGEGICIDLAQDILLSFLDLTKNLF